MGRMYKRALLFFVILMLMPVSVLAAARSLHLGLSGSDVVTVQEELISQGYLPLGNQSGHFNVATQTAVENFQCAEDITCSGGSGYGIAGPHTQAALANDGTSISQVFLTGDSLTGRATGPFELSGWIPDWSAASGTEDVFPHLKEMTAVMPFGYTVSSDGTLVDSADIEQAPWPAFIAQAKAEKTWIIPTVEWGNGADEQAVLSSTTERIALEEQIADTVKENDFDGIDIDFEAKEAETRDYFSTFLQGLYERMGNKWVYCTAESRMPLTDRYDVEATVPQDATDYANDYVAMNKYCDRVQIMAYDQGSVDLSLNEVQTGPYQPVADPKWDTDLVNLAAQSISRNKIILGIPTYGYEFQVTPVVSSTTGYAYEYQMLWPFDPPYATALASVLDISPIRNSAGELSFSYHSSGNYQPTGDQLDLDPGSSFDIPAISYTDGTSTPTGAPVFNFVDWSDANAIGQKVALAKQLGIRGVAIFKFDGAEDPNIWNVL